MVIRNILLPERKDIIKLFYLRRFYLQGEATILNKNGVVQAAAPFLFVFLYSKLMK